MKSLAIFQKHIVTTSFFMTRPLLADFVRQLLKNELNRMPKFSPSKKLDWRGYEPTTSAILRQQGSSTHHIKIQIGKVIALLLKSHPLHLLNQLLSSAAFLQTHF